MLETNATLPTQLTGIINDIDYISADYKPFFHRDNYDIFKDFVQISSKKECVIKLVYDKNTEIMGDIESITEDFPNIPVFIQPVTPFDNEDIRLGNRMK
jgi:hypothetical protein